MKGGIDRSQAYVPKKKEVQPKKKLKRPSPQRINAILLITILIIVLGFWSYNRKEKKMPTQEPTVSKQFPAYTEEEAQRIITTAYHPPDTLFGFVGKIAGISENVIALEINNPDDYLPTQTPRKQIRNVIITPNTELVLINRTQIMQDGTFLKTPLELKHFRFGQTITVTSDENIRDKETFEAKSIQLSK